MPLPLSGFTFMTQEPIKTEEEKKEIVIDTSKFITLNHPVEEEESSLISTP
jgi:hypothetical protein